ncbi:MAG TPA: DUF4760 domain-containing protein [Candidatus Baltobacteraceae bacterium]
MTAEWVTAAAAAGTLVVIAASALAALVQLRHMRTANQVAILNSIEATLDSPDFLKALRYTLREHPAKYADPLMRRRMLSRVTDPDFEHSRTVLNFWESVGSYVRNGMLDGHLVCEHLVTPIEINWQALAPLIYNLRVAFDDGALAENFEYLAVLATQWRERHPRGNYPAGFARMPAPDIWPEAADVAP